jgi:hypothetical protein
MKIIITESQYKLIVENKEYFEQIKQFILNNNFDLAVEVSKAVDVNINDVLNDILVGEHHAYDEENYDFTYEVIKTSIDYSENKTISLYCKIIDGVYYGYDEDEEYIEDYDIFELLGSDDLWMIQDFISDTIKERFSFLKEYDINVVIEYNKD